MSILTYSHAAGESPLERLPAELLRKILIYVALNPRSGTTSQYSAQIQDHRTGNQKPPATSLPCLLTSRTLHVTALPVMYRDITTTLPSTFTKFLAQLRCHTKLGRLIRSLDLCPVITSNIHSDDDEVPPNPLPGLLQQTPLLREFKICPALQTHLTAPVLQRLFSELPNLESIDLSDCNSPSFTQEFIKLTTSPSFTVSNPITTLNLNGCTDLPAQIFSTLLPHLPRLQSLSAASTQIPSTALLLLPQTASLTLLNLNNCPSISGPDLTSFLLHHPASRTLETLSLATEKDSVFLSPEHVSHILTALPRMIRVLDLRCAPMEAVHVPLLARLGSHLEVLAVGSRLGMRDLEGLFVDPGMLEEEEGMVEDDGEQNEEVEKDGYGTLYRPMEEAVAICRLRRRIDSFSAEGKGWGGERSRIRVLDISSMSMVEQVKIRMSVLLGPHSESLERIGLNEDVLGIVRSLNRVCRAVGWEVQSAGRRCWIERGSVA